MRFVFSKLFYALLAVGLVPLSLSWTANPGLARVAYDLIVIAADVFDAWNSNFPKGYASSVTSAGASP